MEKFSEYYKLIPSRYGGCKDIPRLLRHISDTENLALGEVNIFYISDNPDRKAQLIYFTFKAIPEMELEVEKSESEKKTKELIDELGDSDYDYALKNIFRQNGLYDEWNNIDLSRKIPDTEYEIKAKAEKQLELFGKLVGIFSKQVNYYKWKKFDLGDLLKQV